MKKEMVAMLIGGFAFGVLVGFGLAEGLGSGSGKPAPAQPPQQRQGPPPAQQPAQASAPMMEEIGRLREVLNQDPQNLPALKRMANLYHDGRMWSQAVEYYEQVVALNPEDPNILTDLGTCYGGLGRFQEAVALFARANSLKPDHWQSLYNTVIIAGLNMHDFRTAEAALARMEQLPAAREHVPQLRESLRAAQAEHPD